MGRRAALLLVVVVLVTVGLLPILIMLGKSLIVDGRFSLEFYGRLVSSPRQWVLLGNSLILASLTTLLTTAVGLPLGVLLGKTDLPFRRGFATFFSILTDIFFFESSLQYGQENRCSLPDL
jgi:iron(III) transport system permease protein